MGGFIMEVLVGVTDVLGNMAFWAEFYARVGRTYSNNTDYLLISLYVILAVVGIAAFIGKMTSYLRIDRDGITWRPWYFSHHYAWSQVESIADERQSLVHLYKTDHPMILTHISGQKPLEIKAYRFRDPVDPKTGKVQKIEDVLRTYWEAFKQRVTEIPLEKNE